MFIGMSALLLWYILCTDLMLHMVHMMVMKNTFVIKNATLKYDWGCVFLGLMVGIPEEECQA